MGRNHGGRYELVCRYRENGGTLFSQLAHVDGCSNRPHMMGLHLFLGSSMVEHLAVNQRVASSSLAPRATWKVGRVWFNATVLKTVEQKCSVGSNPTLSSRATIRNGTPSYHRIDYSRIFYSDGMLRVTWVTVQDTRIIFPPVDFGLKSKVMDAHIV